MSWPCELNQKRLSYKYIQVGGTFCVEIVYSSTCELIEDRKLTLQLDNVRSVWKQWESKIVYTLYCVNYNYKTVTNTYCSDR